MKVIDNGYGWVRLTTNFGIQLTGKFPSIEALENHLQLMLIAVQQYKEKKVD